MNQIILKEKPGTPYLCLFDVRSGNFFNGACTHNPETPLLACMQAIIKKPLKKIIEIAQSMEYWDEFGYAPHLLAKEYLRLNPDLMEKFKATKEKLDKPKINKKNVLKDKNKKKSKNEVMSAKLPKKADKGQKQPTVKDDVVHKVERVVVDGEAPKKRGRPRKNPVVEAVSNEPKRGRGRPRKNPI